MVNRTRSESKRVGCYVSTSKYRTRNVLTELCSPSLKGEPTFLSRGVLQITDNRKAGRARGKWKVRISLVSVVYIMHCNDDDKADDKVEPGEWHFRCSWPRAPHTKPALLYPVLPIQSSYVTGALCQWARFVSKRLKESRQIALTWEGEKQVCEINVPNAGDHRRLHP